MRVLDEVADAIRIARERTPQPVLSTFSLLEQFGGAITPRHWSVIQRHLGCDFPPLEFVQGHWFLPAGFATIWDLVEHATLAHPEWEPPQDCTVAAWRNAQVFAGVRCIAAGFLGVEAEEIIRETRFVDQLD
jgi:hypothetical protein